jgi:hypothetical protein
MELILAQIAVAMAMLLEHFISVVRDRHFLWPLQRTSSESTTPARACATARE